MQGPGSPLPWIGSGPYPAVPRGFCLPKKVRAKWHALCIEALNLSRIKQVYGLLLAQIGAPHIVGTIIGVLDLIALVSLLLGRGTVGHKLLWIVLILVLPILGMILYYLFGRNASDL